MAEPDNREDAESASIDVSTMTDGERLALAKDFAKEIRDSLVDRIYAGDYTLKSKLPWKVASFREVLIHRTSDIADVAIELYETGRLVPAFIITRAVLETTAMMYWLHNRAEAFLEKPDEAAFDEFLMKGMLGSRDGTTKLESHQVLNAIDQLDKEFVNLRSMYDTLCEYTHPNAAGVIRSYSVLDRREHTLRLGKELRKPSLAFGLGPLIGGLVISREHYNALADLLTGLNDYFENREAAAPLGS